jgi:GrpB-like predicted nucleotidyltransferase (UPF0157 family)
VADEYATIKADLAERYRHDREAYTDAKGPFIERVLAQARHVGTLDRSASGPA